MWSTARTYAKCNVASSYKRGRPLHSIPPQPSLPLLSCGPPGSRAGTFPGPHDLEFGANAGTLGSHAPTRKSPPGEDATWGVPAPGGRLDGVRLASSRWRRGKRSDLIEDILKLSLVRFWGVHDDPRCWGILMETRRNERRTVQLAQTTPAPPGRPAYRHKHEVSPKEVAPQIEFPPYHRIQSCLAA